MTKDEFIAEVRERKETAEAVIRNATHLRQQHVIVAIGAKIMADQLLALANGQTPWRE